MPALKNYKQFGGRHFETGTVHNYFAHRGVKAPHTGKPYSEALLLGISGGILVGYFSFAYKGFDPHVAILTRNTFNPFDTLLVRLGVVQHLMRTTTAERGLKNLLEVLEDGEPAIVWADTFSMPYNALSPKDGQGMFPLIVFGYEDNLVSIADRAAVPLTVKPAELAAARARVKKDKFRVLTMEPPDKDKLAVAVQQGLWDCIKRYTEAPVKSHKSSFGLAAFERWAHVLSKASDKQSWEKVFPPGVKMYAGLMSAFDRFGLGTNGAQRDHELYAEFLGEASVLLDRPALKDAVAPYRKAARGWGDLGRALLPDEIAPFGETRELLVQRRKLFVEKGGKALPEIQKINKRLEAIRGKMVKDFPLTQSEAVAMREKLCKEVMRIADLERTAYETLQNAMSDKR